MHKIEQSGVFPGRLLGPLQKTGLPLMKNLLKPLAKSVSIPWGLTASATDAAIQKKIFGSGMMKIVKSLEESGLLIEGFSETIKTEVKEQTVGFLSILLVTLVASLLGSLLTGKGTIRAGEGTIRAGQDF